jgi:hypothetical protein
MPIMTDFKEIGKMDKELVKVSINILMVIFTQVNGQKILNKATEFCKWRLETNIKEIGLMAKKMDLVLFLFI